MEDEKKKFNLYHRPGMEERLRNTAELLVGFARENLDKEIADEIASDLAGIINDETDNSEVHINIYETCPVLQNDKYALRLVDDGDLNDLLKIYSDVKAVPLFNSDNCHGDDFHYTTLERMGQALNFWKEAYTNGWFVRFAIVDKVKNEVVGTIEEFRRDEKDYFTNCGLLRLDLRSDYETAAEIRCILSLIALPSFELFGCEIVATKAIPIATERIKALTAMGFTKSQEPLIGHDGTKYYDYYVLNKIS